MTMQNCTENLQNRPKNSCYRLQALSFPGLRPFLEHTSFRPHPEHAELSVRSILHRKYTAAAMARMTIIHCRNAGITTYRLMRFSFVPATESHPEGNR